jgi:protein SCO1/2
MKSTLLGFGLFLAMVLPSSLSAQTPSAELTKQIGIDQKLGATPPKDVALKDEDGRSIRFGDLLEGRPVILVPIFYRCVTGCAVISENLMKTLTKATRNEAFVIGRDADVVFLSIHPKETPDLAKLKKNLYLSAYDPTGKLESEKSWTFVTGEEASVRRITDAVGFRYTYNESQDRINHPAGVIILTPEGVVSSYILGTQFPTRILENDVALAAKNEIGVEAESFLFGCIMLDPATGQRRVVIENVVRLAGVFTLLVLIGSIVRMSLVSHRKGQEPLESC